MIYSIALFVLAATFEIVGCWLMLSTIKDNSIASGLGAALCLGLFAVLVSVADLGLSGRTYAAYGGIYIAVALVWFIVVDKGTVSAFDLIGVSLSIVGSITILIGHFCK